MPETPGLVTGERAARSVRIAVSLLPTLVFTLVLAEILRAQYGVAPHVLGGLVLCAIVTTLVPPALLRVPPAQYDSPHLTRLAGHENRAE
ncbi:MAG: hypothetical protein HY217_12665 [Candidatus Rokubacteria bacterium]|nr:hypothetical protein [Candidatus Rokubacteria bacterium]